jgi:uncharacterized membrane protein
VPDLRGPSRSVPAPASGYLEAIDFDALIGCARKHDLVLRLRHRAGEFVYGGNELLRACPAHRDVAFDPIRHYGRDSALVVHGLFDMILVLAPGADARQARMIRDASCEAFAEPWDRERIARKLQAVETALGQALAKRPV